MRNSVFIAEICETLIYCFIKKCFPRLVADMIIPLLGIFLIAKVIFCCIKYTFNTRYNYMLNKFKKYTIG